MSVEQLTHTDVIGIYHDFASTPYGANLADSVRYEKYNLASLPNEQWRELLGPDVNNLEHMRVTYQLTQSFVRHSQAHQPGLLTATDATQLLVAAVIHDQGEALVGDISYGDKQTADTRKEQQLFAEHAAAFTPDASSMLRHYLARARDTIVFDSTTRLGRMFNAIERVGYLRTALRASQQLSDGNAGAAEPGLRWLVADVLSNQIKALEDYRGYAAVDTYLTEHAASITAVFAQVQNDDFSHYGQHATAKQARFAAAAASWHSEHAA